MKYKEENIAALNNEKNTHNFKQMKRNIRWLT